MTVQREQPATPTRPKADDADDPFQLDVTFIVNTPASDVVLMCSTSDNCGSSCPSACTAS